MMPVGIILCGYATYGLGCVLAGRKAGIASVFALLMLPDASMYGLENGFFGYHWLMQISPTSGYAIGITLIALGIYIHGIRTNSFRLVLIATAFTFVAAAFRMHIAILASLVFVILLFLAWQPKKPWYRFAVIVIVILSAIPLVILFESISLAPHFISSKPQALAFFDTIHNMKPSSYEGKFNQWTMHSSSLWKIVLGYLLFLLGFLGVILPCILIVCGYLCVKSRWQIYIIPFIIIFVYLLIIVFMPVASHGDLTDYPHRPFVLVYSVILTFLYLRLFQLLQALTLSMTYQ